LALLQHQSKAAQNIANAQNSNKRDVRPGAPLMTLMEESQTASEERTRPAGGIKLADEK
jgi:hypothetical protein